MSYRDTDKIFSGDMSPWLSERRYFAGDRILREWQEVNELIFLDSGRAKCFISHENGKIGIVDILSAPCLIGELELIRVQKKCSGVSAITDCRAHVLSLDGCRDMIFNDPVFLRFLCTEIGKKTIRNASSLTQNQNFPLRNRLATFLLQTENNGFCTESLMEASSYLGVSYRHLLTIISDLVAENVLKKSKAGYYILNRDELVRESITVHEFEP